MKIALTLSGQPRRYKSGFKQLKKWFLDRYDIDVYLHSWVNDKVHKYHYGDIQVTYNLKDQVYDDLVNWYQPKDYLFEKPINFDASHMVSYHRLNSQMGMWISLYRAWQLLENSGIKYDLIIRSRYDLFFDHFLPLTHPFLDDITKLDPNYVHYPKRNRDPDSINGLNDIFAIGGYDVMKIYHNTFSSIFYYQFECPHYDEKHQQIEGIQSKFYNECLLRWHLSENNIPIKVDNEGHPYGICGDGLTILR